jgi:SAM-dependent methyltransferase
VRIFSGVFRRGVRPVHLKLREVASRAVDRRLGLVTTDEVVADALGADIGEYRGLQRSLGWSGAFRLARRLRLGRDDVFLDMGCGAGRMTCLIARSPIVRVIGVDYDPRFVALATRNAAGLRGRRCPIDIVEADATRFDVPDEVTCVYLYNTFGGELLEAALGRILESMDRRARRVRLVYLNPKEHGLVVRFGRFRPTESMSLGWRPSQEWARTQRVQIYEVESARAPAGRRQMT